MKIRGLPPYNHILPFAMPEGSAPPKISGIATSNKTIEAYLAELQERKIILVVDVRAHPFSRFRPHFNKERLKTSLAQHGIGYEWLEALGNPANEKGERTMQGFRDYMKTPEYQQGLQALMRILEKSDGPIALTCAEKNEAECHRSLIIQDVLKRLSPS